ncbi:YutD family protein [Vagococcus coleopterorum]|uniref:YutD family protein n=1 Tax=Vagococcus coleopterorum TaxID=2714946 RepID=A0A6G8AML4_9ENTE|nr:YutD family protein [Vagococcus coleopterorum]QIL46321.1 YutD family protein [Vagococcus coleopterorum]
MTEDKTKSSTVEPLETEAVVEPVKEKPCRATLVSETNLLIDECAYRIVSNYREAFDVNLLGERYSDVLNRYEYIVGDMGFEQLRLRGFFSDDHQNMPAEQRISSLEDYLYEYCNFGCPYFVIERIGEHPVNESKGKHKRSQNRRSKPQRSNNNSAHVAEKRGKQTKTTQDKKITNRQKPVMKKKTDQKPAVKNNKPSSVEGAKKERGFTIRQKNS